MNGLRDALNFLLNPPQAALRQGVAQSLTSGTQTAITMDLEDRDNDGGHSTSSNTSRYTAQTAGWFRVDGGVTYIANATGIRVQFWRINNVTQNVGGTASASIGTGTSTRMAAASVFMFLNVADFVELFGDQTSGGALLTDVANGAQSYMTVDYRGTT